MSLAIDPPSVTRVLLADGWHDVAPHSFDVDAYEYVEHETWTLLVGGSSAGVSGTGFEFTSSTGRRVAGPLTALLAVEMAEDAA